MFYVYILYSKKLKKRYIGGTEDLKKRIEKHNKGDGSIFTKKGRPWILIHYQAFLQKEDAYAEEAFFKTGKGRERLKYLLQHTMEEL